MADQQRSADGKLIDELAKSGSDLKKLHDVDFYLHFPSQEAAERASEKLVELAFSIELEQPDGEDHWVVRASKVMYPVESDLMGLRDKLTLVAREGEGTYEGWRARMKEQKPAP